MGASTPITAFVDDTPTTVKYLGLGGARRDFDLIRGTQDETGQLAVDEAFGDHNQREAGGCGSPRVFHAFNTRARNGGSLVRDRVARLVDRGSWALGPIRFLVCIRVLVLT